MSDKSNNLTAKIHVWDLPTRMFHWVMLGLVVLAWVSAETNSTVFRIHVLAGMGILVLVLFRLFWGFVGGKHARFYNFLRPWRSVREYAIKLSMFSPPRHIGHNPLGGWMIIGLLVVLGLVVFTGLFSYYPGNSGSLGEILGPGMGGAMKEIHGVISGLLGFMVSAHVLGIFVHRIVSGENIVKAMWTGDKDIPCGGNEVSGRDVGLWRAWVLLGASLGIVWFIVR